MPATPECRAERQAGKEGREEGRKEGRGILQARASCACRWIKGGVNLSPHRWRGQGTTSPQLTDEIDGVFMALFLQNFMVRSKNWKKKKTKHLGFLGGYIESGHAREGGRVGGRVLAYERVHSRLCKCYAYKRYSLCSYVLEKNYSCTKTQLVRLVSVTC